MSYRDAFIRAFQKHAADLAMGVGKTPMPKLTNPESSATKGFNFSTKGVKKPSVAKARMNQIPGSPAVSGKTKRSLA